MESASRKARWRAAIFTTLIFAAAWSSIDPCAAMAAGRKHRAKPAKHRAAVANSSTNHEIDFTNNCPQPVWIAIFNSATDVIPSSWELAPACRAGGANVCPGAGSTCQAGQCTCPAASPSDTTNCFGAPCVASATSGFVCQTQATLQTPAAFSSSRIWGRTGCTGSGASLSCQTGDCNGQLDCSAQPKPGTANRATLFEMSLAALGSQDNYDVSLVSGYNLPVVVQAEQPTDAPGWNPQATFHNGQGGTSQSVISASAGSQQWLFNDVGPSPTATSGTTVPAFSTVLGNTVDDPAGSPAITWRTTTSTCQTGACNYARGTPDPLLSTCPSILQVTDPTSTCTDSSACPRMAPCVGGHCVDSCDTPDDYCAGVGSTNPICTNQQNNSFYRCVNSFSGELDPFGNAVNLESANAGASVCFSADDCAPGTHCLLTPTFTPASNVSWPAGAGLCVPGNGQIPQNGGCNTTTDGQACPTQSFTFPFPGYTCATLTNDGSGINVPLCIPPITPTATGAAAFGSLVWNADNFAATATSCTADSGCATGQYCLEKTINKFPATGTVQAQSVNECTGASDPAGCVCNNVNFCTTNANCTANTNCLDSKGAVCGTSEQCICQVDAVYNGVCGATNPNWTASANLIENASSQNYLTAFKTACPTAYSYQFDDVSSDWSCQDTADQLVNYTVTFCGVGGKGP
jgi:hypothetical protein